MKIGIDARLIHYQRMGIGQYTLRLTQALVALDRDNQYLLLQSRKDSACLATAPNVSRHSLWTPPHNRYEQLTLPLELWPLGLDILHCPDFIPPFRASCRSVITVHDVAFLRFPGLLTSESERYYGQIDRAVQAAAHVIAVSESTKRDLQDMLSAPPEKITVVYEAAGPAFAPVEDEALLADARRRYEIVAPYILFVGTIEPRKNIPIMLQAYGALRDEWQKQGRGEPPQLVIAGQKGWLYQNVYEVCAELGLEKAVRFLGPVASEDLPALYTGALFFVLPSLYEGFGLPVLEAMSCGTAVIASNTSSLPEVAGDAALLVDPQDVVGLTAAMLRLAANQSLRRELRARGLAQAARFSWTRAAKETLAVYEKACR